MGPAKRFLSGKCFEKSLVVDPLWGSGSHFHSICGSLHPLRFSAHPARPRMLVARQSFLSMETYRGYRGRWDPGTIIEGPCELSLLASTLPLPQSCFFSLSLSPFLYLISFFYFIPSMIVFSSALVNCIFCAETK